MNPIEMCSRPCPPQDCFCCTREATLRGAENVEVLEVLVRHQYWCPECGFMLAPEGDEVFCPYMQCSRYGVRLRNEPQRVLLPVTGETKEPESGAIVRIVGAAASPSV